MNTETKHTPGPWQASREDLKSYDGNGLPVLNVYAKDDRTRIHLGERLPLVIAQLQDTDLLDWPELRANARLIASAPDMAKEIAQLKADKAELVAALNGLFNAFPLPVGPDREDYEIARNRIAKHTPKL